MSKIIHGDSLGFRRQETLSKRHTVNITDANFGINPKQQANNMTKHKSGSFGHNTQGKEVEDEEIDVETHLELHPEVW